MAKKFAEHKGLDLVSTNQEILKAWEKKDIFHKSIDEREGNPQFIFFEGPPSAKGRFQPLQDHAGLPGSSQGGLGYARPSC